MEQAAFVLESRPVPVGLRRPALERREVEHRLAPSEARETPLLCANDHHRVELETRRSVGRQHAYGAEMPPARGNGGAGSFVARLDRSQELAHRGVGPLAGARDGARQREHPGQVPPGLAGPARGGCHQAFRVLESGPELPEAVEHRALGEGLRTLDRVRERPNPDRLLRGEPVDPIEGARRLRSLGPRRANERPGGRRREPRELRGEERFHQGIALLGPRDPAERQHERDRRGLGEERDTVLGDRSRHARLVERAQQTADVAPRPSNDHGHVVPVHAIPHVGAPKLPGHGGNLLRHVRRHPSGG